MTEPRIAALAEVMRTVPVRKYVMEAWVDEGVSEPGYATPDEQAAAILDALPPDWCGHGEELRDLADSNRTWSEVSATVCAAAGVSALVHVPAEIARLRKIEEAARALRAARERKQMAGPDLTASILAEQRLYAALEEKP
jgi:hypothetical protein